MILHIDDRAFPDDPYTRWRLAEIAAFEADERRGMRLPLYAEDAYRQERLDILLDDEAGLFSTLVEMQEDQEAGERDGR